LDLPLSISPSSLHPLTALLLLHSHPLFPNSQIKTQNNYLFDPANGQLFGKCREYKRKKEKEKVVLMGDSKGLPVAKREQGGPTTMQAKPTRHPHPFLEPPSS